MNAAVPWVFVLTAVVVAQRVAELVLSSRNARLARARGGREYGAGHFPLFVFVQTVFLAGLVLEVLLLDARPGDKWPFWLGAWLAAQALRYAAIYALGDRWNVRIIVVPGEPLVESGPYRYLRHPNYVAVAIELIAAPLMFGAWRTLLAVTLLNGIALRIRIREEEKALTRSTAA